MDILTTIPFEFTLVALVIGAGIILLGLTAAIMTGVGIVITLIFLRTRQVIIPRVTIIIMGLLEAPIRSVFWLMGVEEDIVGNLMIEVRNMIYKDAYERVPYTSRALFIPQCLRSPQCPAPLTPEGIRCVSCGRCGLGKIKEEAESLGYKFFIAPGSSLIKRMIKKYKPKAVLGVGCSMEVKEGTGKMAEYGLPVQGVNLTRDGCVNTRVDITSLMDRIKAVPGYHIGDDTETLELAAEISNLWNDSRESETIITVKKTIDKPTT
jgi:uncharacterized protein